MHRYWCIINIYVHHFILKIDIFSHTFFVHRYHWWTWTNGWEGVEGSLLCYWCFWRTPGLLYIFYHSYFNDDIFDQILLLCLKVLWIEICVAKFCRFLIIVAIYYLCKTTRNNPHRFDNLAFILRTVVTYSVYAIYR